MGKYVAKALRRRLRSAPGSDRGVCPFDFERMRLRAASELASAFVVDVASSDANGEVLESGVQVVEPDGGSGDPSLCVAVLIAMSKGSHV